MKIHLTEIETTDSTNDELRRAALRGAPEGTAISALSQTEGRGTRGRRFVSEKGGLYLSILLYPKSTEDITAMAAVAAYRAIYALTGAPVKIKKVNDIYLCGKKLAGILSESSFGADACRRGDGRPDFTIVGIGVNVKETDMAEELSAIATSLEKEGYYADRQKLGERFIGEFVKIYEGGAEWRSSYEKYSFT